MIIEPIQAATPKDLEQIKEIFFLTSSVKEFKSVDAQEAFFQKYLGTYLKAHPGFMLKKDEVLGYIVGDTTSKNWVGTHPYLAIFDDLFETYPAHLHINLHPKAQGLGGGSRLIQMYEQSLRQEGVKGLHLITSPEAKNVNFYIKNGFKDKFYREYQGRNLLFMGKIF